jgi:hypothetical protein
MSTQQTIKFILFICFLTSACFNVYVFKPLNNEAAYLAATQDSYNIDAFDEHSPKIETIRWEAPPPSYTSLPKVIPLSESLSSWPEMKQQEQQQDHQQQHQNLVVHKQQEHNNVPLLDCKDMEQIKIIRQIGEGKMKRVSETSFRVVSVSKTLYYRQMCKKRNARGRGSAHCKSTEGTWERKYHTLLW